MPSEKPKPKDMPSDPLSVFLLPLIDSYAAPARAANLKNPRFSPYVTSVETLPESMLLVVAHLDILVHEQLTFVERVKEEWSKTPGSEGKKIEALYVEKPMAFHGYLNCKSVLPKFSRGIAPWVFYGKK